MNALEALERLKSGDESAFDAFYEETRRKVFYAAYSVVRDRSLAEDISQETYVKFLSALDRIDAKGNPVAYLVRSARNCALNTVKRCGREISVAFDAETDGKDLTEYPDYESPLLRLAAETLSSEEFRLVHLVAVEGYTKTEASKILEKPLTTVSWQYRRCLKKLKEQYVKEDDL